MTEPGSSMTKFRIILDLMFSPMGKMYRASIIERYSNLSNKGIYRHLRDLESLKIIKEIKERGRKTAIVLNIRDQEDPIKISEYLLSTNKKLNDALNKAFAECFLCAYGDMPFDSYADPSGKWNEKMIYYTTMGKRPDLTQDQVNEILEIASRIRGELTIKFKLMYVWEVNKRVQDGAESEVDMKQKYALLSLVEKSRPYIEDTRSFSEHSPEAIINFLKKHFIGLARMVDNPDVNFLSPNVNQSEEYITLLKGLLGKEKGDSLGSLLESHWKYMNLEPGHLTSNKGDESLYPPLTPGQSSWEKILRERHELLSNH